MHSRTMRKRTLWLAVMLALMFSYVKARKIYRDSSKYKKWTRDDVKQYAIDMTIRLKNMFSPKGNEGIKDPKDEKIKRKFDRVFNNEGTLMLVDNLLRALNHSWLQKSR
ncbi:hypothetical protein evm_011592 [Chilo suppressalis]|nr:hypothetical protein evm_011592 [Chilo suppressalis]